MNSTRDPYLDLPLDGTHLIEASAGTGKTFTLATLAVRLLIERGLRVGQILAVTYTEAAAQELRAKLRQRIVRAVLVADAWPEPPAAGDDDSADDITRAIVQAQIAREDIADIRKRLRRAEHEMDLAAVFTIHGWCARVLAEHALEAGQDIGAVEPIGDERELREEIATDLWREYGVDPLTAPLMLAQWKDPQALAGDLRALLGATRVLPAPPADSADPLPGLAAAATRLRAAFARDGVPARAALFAAMANKGLNANSYKAGAVEEQWVALTRWCGEGGSTDLPTPNLDRLTTDLLRAKTNKGGTTPVSPLFDAVADFIAAHEARERWLAGQRVGLVHRVRDAARERLARRKRELRARSFDDLIAQVADALGDEHGAALTEQLRTQYAVALVDEFQDTDTCQWAIFRRVFDATTLVLIGDPKQAIYRFRGGDVHAYLAASREATPAPALTRNFRSRPMLLSALDAMYAQAGEQAFVDARIRFRPVQAGGRIADADYQRDGGTAPALTLRVLPAPADADAYSADSSREVATSVCVEAIHALLTDARAGRASIGGRAVRAGDIAVLVRKHDEAARIRAALVMAGISAVAAGKRSVFAGETALDLLTLFEALLRPGDESRLRAALASVLLGLDAGAIAALDADAVAQRDSQQRAQDWRERWQRHGPLPLIADVCAANAPRLLSRTDGERRLTDAMQLGELMQEAKVHAPSLRAQTDWLRDRIARADDNDEAAQLRLESDARCVQILTVHKSKGLEFPLVFLPFVGIGGKPRTPQRLCKYHDDEGNRVLRIENKNADAAGAKAWQDAVGKSQDEDRAEDARLLYVGMTRAQHALWLACGPLHATQTTPLARMLTDLTALGAIEGVKVDASVLREHAPVRLPPETVAEPPPARIARRALRRDWWVHSFSSLKRDASGGEHGNDRGAADENADAAASRFAGPRFGNAVHAALERVDFARWRGALADAPPADDEEILAAALRMEGYGDADLGEGVPLLAKMIGATLNAPLPEGARLCELSDSSRRAEMEFHFTIAPVETGRVIALLHAHGIVPARSGFGLRGRLEGLMTGRVDMVYVHQNKCFVLDYKSNRLPEYGAVALAEAMRESEYDLQALIYTLALHRWLRFRLGAAYDYDTHVGGVRYLFCRGLDEAGAGIHAQRFSRELVEALDALFGANARSAA